MQVLLPPSEGKADPGQGARSSPAGARGGAPADAPVDLAALSLPGLTAARQAVLTELTGLCAADEDKARAALGLSGRQRGEVTKNAGLATAPARPAAAVYTGVLYDALGHATLSAAARRRAGAALWIFSGLWGVVRPEDRIPSYRCAVGARLPGTGGLAAFWRRPMAGVLGEALAGEAAGPGGGLVLDLRSAAYAAMWRPAGEQARRTVTVRVLRSTVTDGVEKRSVVSHFNKAAKGRIVRDLLEADARPASAGELAEALRDLGHRVEEGPDGDAPRRLDVVVTELR